MTVARVSGAQGFGLVEVLVTLFITAVGVLGIAAIVLFSMRASFESSQQSIAALLAIDTHERAWLSANVAPAPEDPPPACDQNWVDPTAFSPLRPIEGLITTVSGAYPDCLFSVEWEGGGVAGVVGGMASFGGVYTHSFTIPSIAPSVPPE